MDPDNDNTAGKKPPAPSVSRMQVTLVLRQMRQQARIEGLNPDLWSDDHYAIIDPEIAKRVGRIYPEMIRGKLRWLWFLRAEPASRGMADSLKEAAAQFKRRYLEVKGRT